MRVELDEGGIRKVVRIQELSWQLMEHAKKAKWIAVATAPKDTGEYIRRMFVAKNGPVMGITNSWASAYYGSSSYKAWWVEFGTRNNRAHHTLMNAAQRAGMRVAQIAVVGRGPAGRLP